MGFFDKLKSGLAKTRAGLSNMIDDIVCSFKTVDEDLFLELEEALIAGDVGAESAAAICGQLRREVKLASVSDPEQVKNMLCGIVADMLSGDNKVSLETKPAVLLIIGVNGAGKTTTIGKLAAKYANEGKKVLVAAADTFRAAAIEQLEVWTQRAGVPVIRQQQGSDPAAVVFDAAAAAKARQTDILICDTAGRLHNKKDLMDELAKIGRVLERELPGSDIETLLVLDGTTGQNAVSQAREFSKACKVTGIVITKLDGTAKGGIVIPIRAELGLPVKFVGVGEKIEDLLEFDAQEYARALFGQGE